MHRKFSFSVQCSEKLILNAESSRDISYQNIRNQHYFIVLLFQSRYRFIEKHLRGVLFLFVLPALLCCVANNNTSFLHKQTLHKNHSFKLHSTLCSSHFKQSSVIQIYTYLILVMYYHCIISQFIGNKRNIKDYSTTNE